MAIAVARSFDQRPEPEPVALYLVDCDRLAEALDAVEGRQHLLPSGEHQRAEMISPPPHSARWRCGRIALRLVLSRYIGAALARTPFLASPQGRPSVAGAAIDFSLSDSGPMLLIAVSQAGRIGVDIEQPRTLKMAPERIARLVAASKGLTDSAEEVSPTQAWTRIEAFAKAAMPSLAACLSALGTAGHRGHPQSLAELEARASAVRAGANVTVQDLALGECLSGAVAMSVAVNGQIADVCAVDQALLDQLATAP